MRRREGRLLFIHDNRMLAERAFYCFIRNCVLWNKKDTSHCDVSYRAGKETWTLMILLSYGPEPYASANSAIPAFIDCGFWKPRAVNKKYVITENRRVQAFFEKNDKFFAIPIYWNKKAHHNVMCFTVQEKRLELSWYCYHTDLNRTRLPIPPFLHCLLAADKIKY